MNDWLTTLAPRLETLGDQVLVTVARVDGSAPREPGATMLIGAQDCIDTIGGGHLEWEAIATARAILNGATAQALVRFNLAATLGQCCGGVVWLLFERVTATDAAIWRERANRVAQGQVLTRLAAKAGVGSGAYSTWTMAERDSQRVQSDAKLEGDAQSWRLLQTLCLPAFPVVLFGAGHVGAALVRLLLPLGAQVDWIDDRDDAFASLGDGGFHLPLLEGGLRGISAASQIAMTSKSPLTPLQKGGNETRQRLSQAVRPSSESDIWAGVRCHITDTPEDEIDAAPAGTCFLVMTQSHELDLRLCERIFQRRDFAYFGMIGSKSKRASFEHRLLARGVDPARLAELTCPIGVPGIVAKDPASIAIAVAAQLLQVRDARSLIAQPANRPSRKTHREQR
ncbi:xanthine dehydrogenase accessory protein XdhC [Andreprevotia chitinilytica]|uniref:xanthine dehydrogenase accessory protein XdhC n=1 Tax=Andreprevotia chitinilytica TaxID=396808 RepID=UPI0006896364|nr:xanthine dehydrogenase accessory protein XdhC [Andreprevotia chitinilytica]